MKDLHLQPPVERDRLPHHPASHADEAVMPHTHAALARLELAIDSFIKSLPTPAPVIPTVPISSNLQPPIFLKGDLP